MRRDPFEQFRAVSSAGRAVLGVFGFVFFSIGILVIGFLWTQPFGGFGSPPLFFRLFGSLIALAFIAVGGGQLFAALKGGDLVERLAEMKSQFQPDQSETSAQPSTRPPAGGYACPQCGAPLSPDAEVSPLGDVKCTYCQRWFNIHQA